MNFSAPAAAAAAGPVLLEPADTLHFDGSQSKKKTTEKKKTTLAQNAESASPCSPLARRAAQPGMASAGCAAAGTAAARGGEK